MNGATLWRSFNGAWLSPDFVGAKELGGSRHLIGNLDLELRSLHCVLTHLKSGGEMTQSLFLWAIS